MGLEMHDQSKPWFNYEKWKGRQKLFIINYIYVPMAKTRALEIKPAMVLGKNMDALVSSTRSSWSIISVQATVWHVRHVRCASLLCSERVENINLKELRIYNGSRSIFLKSDLGPYFLKTELHPYFLKVDLDPHFLKVDLNLLVHYKMIW
jgi:hypothetical protein